MKGVGRRERRETEEKRGEENRIQGNGIDWKIRERGEERKQQDNRRYENKTEGKRMEG